MSKITCAWSPTLGALEDTAENVWGTPDYQEDSDAVFFGVYGLPDFWKIWRHPGKKYVFWAGQDIVHLQNGYHLEDGGNIRVDSTPLAQWLDKYCENWCENEVERKALEEMGIRAHVQQSFLGNVDDYEVTYKQADRPAVYLSANPGRELEYGWGVIEDIADACEVDFYLYGSPDWRTQHSNVFVKGRVPKEQMNEEIKGMQCGLRLNAFDGFSEVTAKSVLWGQYPITPASFKYEGIDGYRNLNNLVFLLNRLSLKVEPNPAREYYKNNLNNFPWVK